MPDEVLGRRDAPACAPSAGETPEALALDLTSEAVRLVARDAPGAWVELGAVPLGAEDFRGKLDALRRQAEALGNLPVTLWLPSGQILVRRYVLKRGDRVAEARRRLAEDTGNRAGDLSVALSPAADGELVTVLGTPERTVAEAVAYARRWGFRPGRVSTRVEADRFGAAGPDFGLPGPAPRRAALSARLAIAAAATILAVGLAGWGAYGLLPASESAPIAIASAPEAEPGPGRGSLGGFTTREAVAPGDPARVAAVPPKRDPGARTGAAELSGAEKDARGQTARMASADDRPARTGEAHAGDGSPPPEPAAAASDAPARLGLGSDAPERRQPVERPLSAAPEAGADIGSLLAGIDRIRTDADDHPARQEPAPEDDVVLAASGAAPVAVPGRPLPRPEAATRGKPDAEAQLEAEVDFVEAEGSDVPPRPGALSDSPLAAVLAPPPPARPEGQWRAAPAPAIARHLPQRVGNAAAQDGLALDATSLIGVIDANSGREALLRTPAGDFLKVSRGDQVAGWRVSAIGQDAMRLTRGGQSRTLLLVTR